MTKQRDSRKIVAAVVGLGQSLGLNTVAEGIETQEQFEMLLLAGLRTRTGFLYGKPIPPEELESVAAGVPQKMSSGLANDEIGHLSSRPGSLPRSDLRNCAPYMMAHPSASPSSIATSDM